MNISINNISQIRGITFGENLIHRKVESLSVPNDSFEKSQQVSNPQLEELNKLFPNGGVEKSYANMAKFLGLDIVPKLVLDADDRGAAGGGFTFNKNEINLSLKDLLYDKQVVIVRSDGAYKPLVSPFEKTPIVASQELCQEFVEKQQAMFNKIGLKLEVKNMTVQDRQKYIKQKMCHELVHAQQHMIMRQTSDIGEKEIIKAWTHLGPENDEDVKQLNKIVDNIYSRSYWAGKPDTKATIDPNSEKGKLAHVWLEAVRHYAAPDTPEYKQNAIEIDAYNRASEYVNKYNF